MFGSFVLSYTLRGYLFRSRNDRVVFAIRSVLRNDSVEGPTELFWVVALFLLCHGMAWCINA